MILAESDFGVLEVFWSILWFVLFFMWIWLVITVFADIIRARDLTGWAKAMWTIGILVLPFLGVFLYLIVNGTAMSRRADDDARAADEASRNYIRDVAGTGVSTSDELHKLADLHSSGAISDAEYERAKARAIGA